MQKLINSNETFELPDEHFEVKHNEEICLFIAYLSLQESLYVHSQNVPLPTANQHHEFGSAHLTAMADLRANRINFEVAVSNWREDTA